MSLVAQAPGLAEIGRVELSPGVRSTAFAVRLLLNVAYKLRESSSVRTGPYKDWVRKCG